MDEHDPVGLALLIVRRRDDQREIEAEHAEHHREPAGPRQHGVGDPLIAQRIGEAMHRPSPLLKLRAESRHFQHPFVILESAGGRGGRPGNASSRTTAATNHQVLEPMFPLRNAILL